MPSCDVEHPWSFEPWRLRREEIEALIRIYEAGVTADYKPLLTPTRLERYLLGDEALLKRLSSIRKASDTNKLVLDALRDDLPRGWDENGNKQIDGTGVAPPRPVAEIREVPGGAKFLPAGSYGTLQSMFLHMMRDWGGHEHVLKSTYLPAMDALRASPCPKDGRVLLPGFGLGRFAMELAGAGYQVECNDASRLFLTVADWVLNRAPCGDGRHSCHPMAHLFQENWNVKNQYLEVEFPVPAPASVAEAVASKGAPAITIVPGDFTQLYCPGGPAHRPFDALITCFFMDALVDLAEFVALVEGLLAPGGVWVNVGPLHFNKEAKLKLSWKEIAGMFNRAGFDFSSQKIVECDYHLPKGVKMFTESYRCVLAVAVKRGGKEVSQAQPAAVDKTKIEADGREVSQDQPAAVDKAKIEADGNSTPSEQEAALQEVAPEVVGDAAAGGEADSICNPGNLSDPNDFPLLGASQPAGSASTKGPKARTKPPESSKKKKR